jgi:hypothetical protein
MGKEPHARRDLGCNTLPVILSQARLSLQLPGLELDANISAPRVAWDAAQVLALTLTLTLTLTLPLPLPLPLPLTLTLTLT